MSLLLLFPGSSGAPSPTGSPDAIDRLDVFPFLTGQGFKILKTPLWNTDKKVSVSGRERSRARWSYPIWRFRLAHAVLRDGVAYLELQRLVNFFNSKGGGATSFYYLDRYDNLVTTNNFGTGDGATTTFQLTRTTTIGSNTFTEPVRGVNGMPTIYDNGIATTAFSVGQFGQIAFTTPPVAGHALTWTGSFFFLCRFDKDELDGVGQVASGIWQNSGLDFRSFKP